MIPVRETDGVIDVLSLHNVKKDEWFHCWGHLIRTVRDTSGSHICHAFRFFLNKMINFLNPGGLKSKCIKCYTTAYV